MGSDDPVTTDAANVYLKIREHRRTLELEKRNNIKHTSFQMGELVCIWKVPKGEKQSGPRLPRNEKLVMLFKENEQLRQDYLKRNLNWTEANGECEMLTLVRLARKRAGYVTYWK